MFIEVDGEDVEIKIMKNDKGFYEYYMLIGVYDPKIMSDKILFKQNTIKNEILSQIKDQLNGVDEKEIEKEAEKNEVEMALESYLERVNQNRQYRAIVVEKKALEREINQAIQNFQSKEIEATEKDIWIKDEFDLDEQADGVRSLRRVIGNIPPEFSKIGMIESSDMDMMRDKKGEKYSTNGVRFDLVVINERTGEIRPLREFADLQQSKTFGDNPRSEEDSYLANNDGTAHNNDNADVHEKGIYEIAGKNLIIELGAKNLGDEVMYVGKRAYGQRNFTGMEMTGDNNFFRPNNDEKERVNGHWEGQYSSSKGLTEAEHEVQMHGEDIKDERQMDGEIETKENNHARQITITDELLQRAAKIMLKNDSQTNTVYNQEDIVQAIKNRYEKAGYQIGKSYNADELKELTKILDDEMEERAEGQRVPGKKEDE